jgi:hypothetical protein
MLYTSSALHATLCMVLGAVCYAHTKIVVYIAVPWMPLSAWVVGLQFLMLIPRLLYIYHNKLQSHSIAHT